MPLGFWHHKIISSYDINLSWMALGSCGSNFKDIIFGHMLLIKFMSTSCDIALMWMPHSTVYDKSALFQVMAWCYNPIPKPMNEVMSLVFFEGEFKDQLNDFIWEIVWNTDWYLCFSKTTQVINYQKYPTNKWMKFALTNIVFCIQKTIFLGANFIHSLAGFFIVDGGNSFKSPQCTKGHCVIIQLFKQTLSLVLSAATPGP